MEAFTYDLLASSLHDPASVVTICGSIVDALERLGGGRGPSLADRPHLLVVATGGTEAAVLDAVAERGRIRPDEPVFLVAHPGHNSLPAALEAMARLRADGVPGRIVFVDGDPSVLDDAVADLVAAGRLAGLRLGLIGHPSEWLVASVPDAEVVRRRWGPELVPVHLSDVLRRAVETPVTLGADLAARLAERASDDPHGLPPAGRLDAAAHLHPVLRSLVRERALDAVTVRCFDFLTELRTSGCVALAELDDEGVVAGCEGDIPAALAKIWIRELLAQPSWMANPAAVEPLSGVVDLAHCTVAPSMVGRLSLSTHFESGIGVGLHGLFEPGPVTLVRIGGADLDEIWLAEGRIEADAADADPDRCRTQVRVVAEEPATVAELLDRPLGNHLVMVYGHQAARLRRWWATFVEPSAPPAPVDPAQRQTGARFSAKAAMPS